MWTKGVSLPPTILMARFSWGLVRLILMQVISPSGIRWYNLGKPGNAYCKVFIWHHSFALLKHALHNYKYLPVSQTGFYAWIWFILSREERIHMLAEWIWRDLFFIYNIQTLFFPHKTQPWTFDVIQTDEMYLKTATRVNILREQNTFLVTRDPSEAGYGSLLVLKQVRVDTSTNIHRCCGGCTPCLTGSIPGCPVFPHFWYHSWRLGSWLVTSTEAYFYLHLAERQDFSGNPKHIEVSLTDSSPFITAWTPGRRNDWFLPWHVCVKTTVFSRCLERKISTVPGIGVEGTSGGQGSFSYL